MRVIYVDPELKRRLTAWGKPPDLRQFEELIHPDDFPTLYAAVSTQQRATMRLRIWATCSNECSRCSGPDWITVLLHVEPVGDCRSFLGAEKLTRPCGLTTDATVTGPVCDRNCL